MPNISPRCLVTTPHPESGEALLVASGSVTVLPTPPDHETLHRLCASADFDVVLTQVRDVVDVPLLAHGPRGPVLRLGAGAPARP